MAQPAKKFEPSSLPDPELNPLENPLLSANMGRWAHVYYTTSPEGRDQAVYELLCELKGKSTPPILSPRLVVKREEVKREEQDKRAEKTARKEMSDSPPDLKCAACGHQNPPGQKFCGMCGVALPLFSAVDIAEVNAPAAEREEKSAAVVNAERAPEPARGPEMFNPARAAVESSDPFPMPTNRGIFFPPLSPREDGLPGFAVESEPVNYRSRIYIGAALAVLLAALLYIEWGRTGSDNARTASVPRAVPQEVVPAASPAPESGTPPVTRTEGTNQTAVNRAVANPSDAQPVPRTASRKLDATANARKPAAASRPLQSLSPASAKSPLTPSGEGEDFAIAQRYLTGPNRNTAEAAPLLWKAVGNGSVPATVALADLYLHGDGVPRSCDQGHLLLDAAARKGSAAAALRLRNLPAFGCQ